MRQLVIGDLHGAYKCLVEVLDKAGPADRIIFLGDYVDGLPDTPEVIMHLAQLMHDTGCVFIRGNHDQWALDWIQGMYAESKQRELAGLPHDPDAYRKRPDRNHYEQGGKATYDAYMALPEERRVLRLGFDAGWLSNTVEHFIDEKGRAFVHGGFDHSGLEGCPLMTKMWDRELMETAYRLHNRMGAKVPEYFGLYPEIYVGHTAAKFFTGKEEPANWLNLWAMDTNCGWGGPLVAMDVDTKEMFYSRPAREHYPEYKGR